MASWFDDDGGLERRAELLNRVLGTELEYWPKPRLREDYDTARYHGAIFNPDSLTLHPLNFTRGLARAAAGLGVRIHEASAATALDLEAEPKTIRTLAGAVRAEQVVICCSGYIDKLHGRLGRATLPVQTYVMVTEPLGDRLAEAIRAPHGIADNRSAQDYYRPLADGRILWGGRVGCFETPPRRLAEVMRRCMVRVYPQLAEARVELAWAGRMGYARHKMPQIGQLTPGLWYAMGFGGSGMCPTTIGGELVASAIAEGDQRYRLFEPFGLDFAGAALGPAVAQIAYWSYQFKDWLRS